MRLNHLCLVYRVAIFLLENKKKRNIIYFFDYFADKHETDTNDMWII